MEEPLLAENTKKQKKIFDPSEWSIKDFQIGCPVGRGAFGKVYLARTRKEKRIVALKVIGKEKVKSDPHLFAREIEIHGSLSNHKNILSMYGYFWDEKRIYIITEYAYDGDLYNKMNSLVSLTS